MTTITTHFTEEFNSELFTAFQNKGGVFRSRVRRKTGVVGYRCHFPKIGLGAVAQGKTRKGKVPLMDIIRTRVSCDLTDMYGADMIDDLDELKTNVMERQAVQEAIAMSLARSEDDYARDALATTSNANNSVGAADTEWTTDVIPRTVLEQFGVAEAMEGGMMHALVTWATWADALALNSFINSDYGGDPQLTVEGQRPKMWFGFAYTPYSRLPLHSSTNPLNMWWNQRCIGVAVGKEITPETSWEAEYDAHLVKGKMSQGAVLIEDTGAIIRRYAA